MTDIAAYDKIFYQEPSAVLRRENAWVERIVQNLSLKGSHCLDFGCGSGSCIALLLTQGARVAGVDISPEAIRHCRSAYPECKFDLLIEGEDLPFEAGSFDLVAATWVLQEICAPGALEHYLHEITRVLTERGRFLVVNNVYPDPGRRELLETTSMGDIYSNPNGIPSQLRFFPLNSMSKLMDLWGLTCREASMEGWSFHEIYEKRKLDRS